MRSRVSQPPALVISLDFELQWGVRDHSPRGSRYERNLMGARDVIPGMLKMFEEHGVAATWATVGFLFARSRADLDTFRPAVLPTYGNPRLFPYGEQVGNSEEDDPLHYAPSLIELIRNTPRQELATHTYSHFFCTESGQTAEQFDSDLQAARAIAAPWGVDLRSIVFPRNQHNPAYDEVLRRNGIVAYRGNPRSWMWHFADAVESAGRRKRAARLADTYLNITGNGAVGWDEVLQPSGLADVRASFLVRAFKPRLRRLERLRLGRLTSAVREAARSRQIIHLWWHPHNFGAYPEQCLSFLGGVMEEFVHCREEYGMEALTMAEVADAVGAVGLPSRPEAPSLSRLHVDTAVDS
ncbi:polysaccharide deacetylase family protein [soil metagenome]